MKAPACGLRRGKRSSIWNASRSFQVFQVQGREKRVGAPVFQTEQCPDTHFLYPGRACPVGEFPNGSGNLPSVPWGGTWDIVVRYTFLGTRTRNSTRPRVAGRSRPCREVALQGRSARTCPVPSGSLSRSSPPWSRQAPRPTRAAGA